MQTPVLPHSKTLRTVALLQSVACARFVNEARAKTLAKLGIFTIKDLIEHIPARYIDLTNVVDIGNNLSGDVTVMGTITGVSEKRPRPKLKITEVALSDESGTVIGVWFNQPWVHSSFEIGQRCGFAGTMKFEYGMRRIINPFTQKLDGDSSQLLGTLVPVYPATEGLSQGWLRRIIWAALEDYVPVLEYLPTNLSLRDERLSYSAALRAIHHPQNLAITELARSSLAYHEVFELLLAIQYQKIHDQAKMTGVTHLVSGPFVEAGMQALGQKPTLDQGCAIEEIYRDMASTHAMSRMLLGDVGTGKTLVAVAALLACAQSGTQAAMIAPTGVLAQQYAEKIGPTLDSAGIEWHLLTSATTPAVRNSILADAAKGTLAVLFGTHALLEDDVAFRNLSLVVIDEQHRFGVEQRKRLRLKAKNPDVLVMSATPIPRSLALTCYGDLDISTLRQRPIAGSGVKTKLLLPHNQFRAHEAIKEALTRGEQAYIVCALIDESEKIALQSATALANKLKTGEYADWNVGLLHGALKDHEKLDIMQQFRSGKIDVLVSTTVIEVGVDVHNATHMVLYNAERFGLAQIHQLRGRVGRGSKPGTVWMVSDGRSPETKARFAALLETDDGFVIAQKDLEIRGSGDILGSRQHGAIHFKIADLSRDLEIVETARRDVSMILDRDPELTLDKHALVYLQVSQALHQRGQWVSAG